VASPFFRGDFKICSGTAGEKGLGLARTVERVAAETNAFVGGAISTGEDVAKAFEQGADAVGAASAVVGSEDPCAALADLASGFP
jgi:imidazole glycerol phosphate synthase subunit HisF